MPRFARASSPAALLISVLALVVVVTGAGAAYAAATIGTAQLKNNAVTSPKIKNGTITTADLAPATVKSLRGTSTYWAYITQAGAVGRGSGGITSEAVLNGGFWQYRVTFPRDVSTCGYQASTGDAAAIGSNEYVIPALIGVARSTQGPRVLAVNVFQWDTGTSIQDSFFLAVHC